MHKPVLLKEVLYYLKPGMNENFIDCTAGEGGHSLALLIKNGPNGKVLSIDRDLAMIDNLKQKIKDNEVEKRLILICDNFVNLKKIIVERDFYPVHGILFDLGISSWHFEESGRGFTFRKDEVLDMRCDTARLGKTAADIINEYPQQELEGIIKDYGQERFAAAIARKIIETRKSRPIRRTSELISVIATAVPVRHRHQKLHFATKTFQALRIAVNSELDNIKAALPQALEILELGGKLAVISFHSLEDRIIKNFFREAAKNKLASLPVKKIIKPARQEIQSNPRSRSSKLRILIKI